jgi:hypothetical protein
MLMFDRSSQENSFHLFICAVFVMLSCIGSSSANGTTEATPDGELQALQDMFSSYKAATLDNNGEIAAGLVTPASVNHFEILRQTALFATWRELRGFHTIDKMYVWALRMSIEPGDLLAMSAYQVLDWFYTQGYLGDNLNKGASLRDVVFAKPDIARGVIYINEKPSPQSVVFRKEDAAWRYDLLNELNYLNNRMLEIAEELPFVEHDLAQVYVQQMTGKILEQSHMHPLINREAAEEEDDSGGRSRVEANE